MMSKKIPVLLTLTLLTLIVGSGVGIFAYRSELDEPQPPIGDALPSGAIGRLGTMRFRHPFWVGGLSYSADGKTLASACWDGTVRLWDAETGKETHCF